MKYRKIVDERFGRCYYNDNEGSGEPPPKVWQSVRSWQSVPCQLNSFSLVRYTILAKYAKMAKAGACQKMEKPAVVVEEW